MSRRPTHLGRLGVLELVEMAVSTAPQGHGTGRALVAATVERTP